MWSPFGPGLTIPVAVSGEEAGISPASSLGTMRSLGYSMKRGRGPDSIVGFIPLDSQFPSLMVVGGEQLKDGQGGVQDRGLMGQ